MQVKVKPEPIAPTANADPTVFSTLQSELWRMKERTKLLRKRILPVRKRLQKHMEKEQIVEMRCGSFVLEMDVDSDSGSESVGDAVFSQDRVRKHFGDDQYETYCANNQRVKRKRPKLSCRRDIVEVDSE